MTQKLILVLNCGSSSLKGAVLDNDSGEVLLSCLAEKLNLPDAYITFKFNGEKHKVEIGRQARPYRRGRSTDGRAQKPTASTPVSVRSATAW